MNKWQVVAFDVSGTIQESDPTSPVYPWMVEALKKLKSEGVKTALATNLSNRGLEMFFESTGLKDLVDIPYCAGMCDAKPSPEMLDMIAIESGVPKTNILMVGDTEADLYSAKNAGVKFCAVSWRGISPSILQNSFSAKPDYVATDAEMLFKILDIA